MSQNVRPTVGSRPAMAGRMMPVAGPTGYRPGVLPVLPNAYGLVSGQHPQYFTHPPFTQNLQNIPNRIPVLNAVPGPMPRMFVPVAPVNAGISSQNMDPTKLLEEQRRLEKERNFQLQQQRLKQFTIAGKKGSLNAENLIDSMFGKVPPKQVPVFTSSSVKPVASESHEPFKMPKPTFESAHPPPLQPCAASQEISPSVPAKASKRDKKELDAMMRECSDLRSGPQKAHTFSKPAVRELAPTLQQRSTFTASNKSRDWKNLQGFEEVFVANKPRLPEWCKKDSVPELYRQIETFVTNNGANEPDTKLLFPILVSSGLPHQTLGQIWELVNQSAPGYLTVEEMYAALALIAVTQAGYPVKSVDILQQLHVCPIPQLQCFTTPTQSVPPEEEPNASQSLDTETAQTDAGTHQVLRPSAISFKASLVPSRSERKIPASVDTTGSGFISSPDDDFDDFKSATPTAVNFPMSTPSSVWTQGNDDFDDFKQAPMPISSTNNNTIAVKPPLPSTSETKFPTPALPLNKQPVMGLSENKYPVPSSVKNDGIVASKTPSDEDLMSPEEDKYSVFRSLQQTAELDEWCDFSTATSDGVKQPSMDDSSQSNTPTFPPEFLSNPASMVPPQIKSNDFFSKGDQNDLFGLEPKENDDFGDFLHAEATPVAVVTSKLEGLTSNFADFANFKEPEFHPVPPTYPTDSSQLDDEFGDFASTLPVPCKAELGHEFLFQHVKDNISLAESQSVSSLELGTFDGAGHSGESKSSLSRQGSIPSLDLKNSGVELADNDDFGDFQSPACVRNSKTPSPAKDMRVNGSNNSFVNTSNLAFQNTRNTSLIDKYSVIRAEERKEEDQHISCWIRCLQSSVNILQNTKKIFNQMSCSSVCNEVLKSEEGENYIKDVIEVYKVISRIAVSSKAVGKQTIPMLDLLKEADQTWNTICGFFAGSNLMPEDSSLEFSNAVSTSNSEDSAQACGLCLLNIDIKRKSKNQGENLKLSYGGRNYHSTCANLWVNCVDRLLPALTLPQLL